MTINNVVLDDAGLYAVVAENKAGSDRTDARLDVLRDSGVESQPRQSMVNVPRRMATPQGYQQDYYTASEYEEEPSVPPRIIVPLKNTVANEGSLVTLTAKILGTPTPRVNFLENILFIFLFVN